jgi:hypothetical protein
LTTYSYKTFATIATSNHASIEILKKSSNSLVSDRIGIYGPVQDGAGSFAQLLALKFRNSLADAGQPSKGVGSIDISHFNSQRGIPTLMASSQIIYPWHLAVNLHYGAL